MAQETLASVMQETYVQGRSLMQHQPETREIGLRRHPRGLPYTAWEHILRSPWLLFGVLGM